MHTFLLIGEDQPDKQAEQKRADEEVDEENTKNDEEQVNK